jgi:hypothetical protein
MITCLQIITPVVFGKTDLDLPAVAPGSQAACPTGKAHLKIRIGTRSWVLQCNELCGDIGTAKAGIITPKALWLIPIHSEPVTQLKLTERNAACAGIEHDELGCDGLAVRDYYARHILDLDRPARRGCRCQRNSSGSTRCCRWKGRSTSDGGLYRRCGSSARDSRRGSACIRIYCSGSPGQCICRNSGGCTYTYRCSWLAVQRLHAPNQSSISMDRDVVPACWNGFGCIV